MKQKILSFIYDGEKFLALHSKPHKEHGPGGWFVVTGGIENTETPEEAVAREIMEETDLTTKEIIFLNWKSIYEWNGETCEEYNFISFVDRTSIKLNEEHNEYRWANINEFIKTLKWDDNKILLKEILEMGINKKKYFKKIKLKDYRK